MNPSRFFEIHYTNRNYSRAELTRYAQDHLAKLLEYDKDHPEELAEILLPTATQVESLLGAFTDVNIAGSVAKARTAAKGRARETVNDTIRRRSKTIAGELGDESPAYLEFFPRGVTEVYQCTEVELGPILGRLISAAETHLPDLKPDFASLLTSWNTASGAAASQRAQKAASGQDINETLDALRFRLSDNQLFLGRKFLGKPEMASLFFNPSLLHNRQSASEEEDPEDSPLPPEPEAAE